jgi:hypothetical protein
MYYSLYIYYKKPANFAGNLVFYISMYIHILYFYAHVCCMFLCTCMFYISDLQHICYVWWMCFSTDSRHTYRYKLWSPDFFIYWLYEADFIQGLLKKNEKKLSRFFNFTLHYINDVLSLNILGMVTSLIWGRRGRDRMVVYNYLCNQCLSPLMLWVRISIRARCTTLYDTICQWLATGRWFSPDPPVSSPNKTDRHAITEILLKVALSTIKQTKTTIITSIQLSLK